MKATFFFTFGLILHFVLCGCSDNLPGQDSLITFKNTGNIKSRSTGTNSESKSESVIFTAGEILLFNATTGELKLRNEESMTKLLEANHQNELSVYLSDEYLFPIYIVNPVSSAGFLEPLAIYYEVSKTPVIDSKKKDELYDGKTKQKYSTTYSFRLEGRPWLNEDANLTSEAFKGYHEKWEQMEIGWQRFVAQLKAEGRYTK